MYGVKIGGKHTWNDLGLKCLGCKLASPEPSALYLSVPGMDGNYDATEAVYGRVVYKPRAFEASFEKQTKTQEEHEALCAVVNGTFAGKRLKIIEDSDLAHYITGRISVKNSHDDIHSVFSVAADCDPYRYKTGVTSRVFTVSGSLDITLANSPMPVSPTVYTSDKDMSIEHRGVRYSIPTGGIEIDDITLLEGSNSLKLYGAGTVTIEYREGEL